MLCMSYLGCRFSALPSCSSRNQDVPVPPPPALYRPDSTLGPRGPVELSYHLRVSGERAPALWLLTDMSIASSAVYEVLCFHRMDLKTAHVEQRSLETKPFRNKNFKAATRFWFRPPVRATTVLIVRQRKTAPTFCHQVSSRISREARGRAAAETLHARTGLTTRQAFA